MLDLTGALGFSQKSVRNPPKDDWKQKHTSTRVSTLNHQLNLKKHLFHSFVARLIYRNSMLVYKSILMPETAQ